MNREIDNELMTTILRSRYLQVINGVVTSISDNYNNMRNELSTYLFELGELKRKVSNLQSEIDDLNEEVDKKRTTLDNAIKEVITGNDKLVEVMRIDDIKIYDDISVIVYFTYRDSKLANYNHEQSEIKLRTKDIMDKLVPTKELQVNSLLSAMKLSGLFMSTDFDELSNESINEFRGTISNAIKSLHKCIEILNKHK